MNARRVRGLTAVLALGAAVVDAQANAGIDEAGIERIVVLSSPDEKRTIAGAADYVDLTELESQSYTDIHRILRAVPGVNIQEEDGFGLRPNIGLRGTGLDRSSKITLMEDGVLIAPAPYAAPSAYYFPHVGRMQGIEIVKGAAGIKYGPRTQGGSINFFSTAVPEELSAFGKVQVGDFNTKRVHGYAGGPAFTAGDFSVGGLVEGFFDETDGFKELDGGGDTGYQIEDYVGKLMVRHESGSVSQTLSLKLQYSDEQSNETYLGLTDEDFAADPFRRYRGSQNDLMDAEHSEISLRWSASFKSGLDLGLVAYRTDFARDWFKIERVNADGSAVNSGTGGSTSISAILEDPLANAAAFEVLVGAPGFVSPDGAVLIRHNNREYFAQGVQAIAGYQTGLFGMDNDIEISLRWHEDEVDRFQWYERFRMDNGTLVRTGVDTPGTESNRVQTADALAGYIQDTVRIGRWTIVPGVRFEHIELKREDYGRADPRRTGSALSVRENTVNVVIPGLGLIFDPNDNWSVFAGVHRGFSPPGPGSVNTDAEEAVNFEAGVRWFDDTAYVETIGFFNDYSNIIGTCTASTGGGCTIGDQFDGGEVDVLGLEVAAGVDLGPWFDLPFSVPLMTAYTFTSAEFQNGFESDFDPWGTVLAGDRLPYIPAHQLFFSAGLTGETWGSDLNVSYVSEVRTRAGQGTIDPAERVEGRTVVDLSAYIVPIDHVRLTINVRNLLDAEYAVARRPAGLRPGLPRTFLAGIAFDL